MKTQLGLFLVSIVLIVPAMRAEEPAANAQIDYAGFADAVQAVHKVRASRRVSVEQFIEMAGDPDTIVLDTRSRAGYELMHIAGAKHLSFSDITGAALAALIPTKDTRILIYCNNNFVGPVAAFPLKRAVAALNIPTFVTLYSYGYENVYELGPVVPSIAEHFDVEGSL